eukprot:COSAG04_NODE_537_length_12906_cov_3.938705_5_plen_212_part_00
MAICVLVSGTLNIITVGAIGFVMVLWSSICDGISDAVGSSCAGQACSVGDVDYDCTTLCGDSGMDCCAAAPGEPAACPPGYSPSANPTDYTECWPGGGGRVNYNCTADTPFSTPPEPSETDDCADLEDHCDLMGLLTLLCIVRFVLILICLITSCMGLCCFTPPQAAMQPQVQMQAVVTTGQVVTQGQPVQAVVMAPAQAVPMEQPMAKAP